MAFTRTHGADGDFEMAFPVRDLKVFRTGAEIAECQQKAQRLSLFLSSLRHGSTMNTKNCRETAVKGMAQQVSDQRLIDTGDRDGHSSSVTEWIEETAGVWLAAVFTVIAGAGTIQQVVAFFR